ncbi:hypothetical protein ACLKA6_007522 [Drosophila palustris]
MSRALSPIGTVRVTPEITGFIRVVFSGAAIFCKQQRHLVQDVALHHVWCSSSNIAEPSVWTTSRTRNPIAEILGTFGNKSGAPEVSQRRTVGP